MAMKWAAPLTAFGLIVAATHATAVGLAPIVETEKAFARFKSRGLEPNRIQTSGLRTAGQDLVPMTNPDTLTARAILDTSGGPLRLAAQVPEGAAYWSMSIFARDTDVAYMDSDRSGSSQRLYVFAGAGQSVQLRDGETLVRLADTPNYLLVRAVPSHPTDSRAVAALKAVLDGYQLTAVDAAEPSS